MSRLTLLVSRRPSGSGLVLVAGLIAALAACGGSTGRPGAPVAERDTLPDGTVVVRYGSLPATDARLASVELRIGALEGEPAYVFGNVRSIDAASDGTMYVLDYQATEIRTYDPQGRYLRTLASRGEGPGELTEVNGMILIGDTLLWVQDHGKMAMLGFTRDGTEVHRIPMHVRNYGYAWNGTVDDENRFWKPDSHSDRPRGYPPEPGLQQTTFRSYFVSYDFATGARDSTFLGTGTRRYYVTRMGEGGYRSQGVPFDATPVTVVDPGGGLWRTNGASYEVLRLNEAGDTTLIISAEVAATPVTDSDRADFIAREIEEEPTLVRTAENLAAAMPATKPVISDLLVDDEGTLWVRRGGREGAPLFDLFSRDGVYGGAVRLDFQPAPYLPIRVRDGRLYAVVRDDLDVPYVVRAVIGEPPGR